VLMAGPTSVQGPTDQTVLASARVRPVEKKKKSYGQQATDGPDSNQSSSGGPVIMALSDLVSNRDGPSRCKPTDYSTQLEEGLRA